MWYLQCLPVYLPVDSHWLRRAQDSRSTEVFVAEDCDHAYMYGQVTVLCASFKLEWCVPFLDWESQKFCVCVRLTAYSLFCGTLCVSHSITVLLSLQLSSGQPSKLTSLTPVAFNFTFVAKKRESEIKRGQEKKKRRGGTEISAMPLFVEGAWKTSSYFLGNMIKQSTLKCMWSGNSVLHSSCGTVGQWELKLNNKTLQQPTQGSFWVRAELRTAVTVRAGTVNFWLHAAPTLQKAQTQDSFEYAFFHLSILSFFCLGNF